MATTAAALDYYAEPGVMTDLTDHAARLTDVPSDPREVAAMVQGLVIHPHWAVAYDVEMTPGREAHLRIRGAGAIIDGILRLDDRPLTDARPPASRFTGNCRDISTLTTALLRCHGTPARARCGFAGYFEAGRWVDHWIVEHWNGSGWQKLDPQIDELQREIIGLEPDPADLPEGHFLTAAEAWRRCRRGEAEGDTFGIMDMWGEWFVASNVGRDLAAMNKIEMLPWDDWGALATDDQTPADDALVDEIADLLHGDDTAAVRARYDTDPDLQVSSTVMSIGTDGTWGPQAVVELS